MITKTTPCPDSEIPDPKTFLFKEFDKHERIRALAWMAPVFDVEDYWNILGLVWTHNESLFQDADIIGYLWSGCDIHDIEFRNCVMDGEERLALDALPDEITVWRGCFRDNLQGWSWTTSREEALFFTDRHIPDGPPLLAHGRVEKRDVLAFFAKEQEIVVDPGKVLSLGIAELPKSNESASAYYFFMAQTGRIQIPGLAAHSAVMMVEKGATLEQFERQYEARLTALRYYGFDERAAVVESEMEEVRDAILKSQATSQQDRGLQP